MSPQQAYGGARCALINARDAEDDFERLCWLTKALAWRNLARALRRWDSEYGPVRR